MVTREGDSADFARQVRRDLFKSIDPFGSQLTPEHQQLNVLVKTFPLWEFAISRPSEGAITWVAKLQRPLPQGAEEAGLVAAVVARTSFDMADLLADQMAIIERLHEAGWWPV